MTGSIAGPDTPRCAPASVRTGGRGNAYCAPEDQIIDGQSRQSDGGVLRGARCLAAEIARPPPRFNECALLSCDAQRINCGITEGRSGRALSGFADAPIEIRRPRRKAPGRSLDHHGCALAVQLRVPDASVDVSQRWRRVVDGNAHVPYSTAARHD